MVDVVVVGSGLAGSIAALTAHAQGAKVALASRGYGATALSHGALEVAFAPAVAAGGGPGVPLSEHVAGIVHARPRHPYGILGIEQVQADVAHGYALLAAVLAGTGLDVPPELGWQQRNAHAVSSLGCLLPVAMPLGPHRGWSPTGQRPWGVLQIAQDPSFDAKRICLGVRHDAALMGLETPDVRPIVVSMPNQTQPYASPFMLAQQLDSQAACAALGEAVRVEVAGQGLAGLIVPPAIGLDHFPQARQWLAEGVGLPVIEALAHAPSVPGLRLQRALTRAMEQAGIRQVGPVSQLSGSGCRLERATLADGSPLDGGAFVLACGRFIAGGISWTQDVPQESLVGLPLVTELGLLEARSPQSVLRESPAEAHPLMTAGLGVNARLQPLREGEPAYTNLFAAGMILGGFSSRYLLCADGVALATAHRAAQQALAAASGP
jgi:glycerol-3-phosphate dehydrogenase subunit B